MLIAVAYCPGIHVPTAKVHVFECIMCKNSFVVVDNSQKSEKNIMSSWRPTAHSNKKGNQNNISNNIILIIVIITMHFVCWKNLLVSLTHLLVFPFSPINGIQIICNCKGVCVCVSASKWIYLCLWYSYVP